MHPVLRALALGAAVTVSGATMLTTLTGCEDERDPATHVKKLDDPVKRHDAIETLKRAYLDAMATDKTESGEPNRDGPKVKALRDKIIEPLAKLIIDGALDTQVSDKVDVLGILADSRDERALPALVKVLNDYKPDDKRPEDYDTKIGEVVLNLGEMVKEGKLKGNAEVNAALFGLFKRLEFHMTKAQHRGFYRLLNHVLLRISDPSWEGELIKIVEVPIKTLDKRAEKQVLSEVYWQVTASEILGNIKSKSAVRPLIKVVLSPFKGPIGATAMAALIKTGKPALEAAAKLLSGEDEELKTYAKDEYLRAAKDKGEEPKEDAAKKEQEKSANNAYLDHAVVIIGNMGSKDAVAPLMKIVKDEEAAKTTRATVAAQFYKLPIDGELVSALKDLYTKVEVTDKLPSGEYAKEALITSAILFFDRDLNNFIFNDSVNLKGDNKEAITGVQATVLDAAIRAATPEQWTYVEQLQKLVLTEIKAAEGKQQYFIKNAKAGDKEEGPFSDKQIVEKILKLELSAGMAAEKPEKEGDKKNYEELDSFGAFATALSQAQYINAAKYGKKLLDECQEKVDCYFAKLTDPEADKLETAMIGVKSAYMVGLLGGDDIKAKLVEILPRVTSGSVRATIGQILVRKSPGGDDAVVTNLTKWISAQEETRDQEKMDVIKPYKQIAYILEGRK
jgi:HEAT repeat protein